MRGDGSIYRVHRAAKGAWWFSSDGGGRFDPVGTGKGAVYFAERPLGGWIEVFRKQLLLTESEVRERALFTVELGRDLRLADLTSRRALEFGVTASLGADQDYDDSHAFGADVLRAGFDGIRYLVRHDPAQRLYGLALFGDADAGDSAWPAGEDNPLPDELVAEAEREFGHRVLPPP